MAGTAVSFPTTRLICDSGRRQESPPDKNFTEDARRKGTFPSRDETQEVDGADNENRFLAALPDGVRHLGILRLFIYTGLKFPIINQPVSGVD